MADGEVADGSGAAAGSGAGATDLSSLQPAATVRAMPSRMGEIFMEVDNLLFWCSGKSALIRGSQYRRLRLWGGMISQTVTVIAIFSKIRSSQRRYRCCVPGLTADTTGSLTT